MSQNPIAKSFAAPPKELALPGKWLQGAQGRQRLSELRGRTYLVSLWAEWCAPCLEEATDLAAINRAHGGPSFGVIFVLTDSFKKLDFAAARAVLERRGAGDVPLLVEAEGDSAVFKALATRDLNDVMRKALGKDSLASLPCNLLVDRHGRVRARSFGAFSASKSTVGASRVGTLTETDKAKLLSEHTAWATPAGDEFAAALAAGVLEKA